jgi:hypothetical protein
MFVATALLYPCVLAALCAGAGLLVDRVSGRWLPMPLLIAVGAAALIALSQLSTYAHPLAPATPYLIVAVALLGLALGWGRVRTLIAGSSARSWLPAASLLTYVLALAPVLAAGRPSFSSYMTLADSAVHMMGADFLLHHGQDYAHLDLGNSYGQFINDYYNSSYPSGADTLLGASAFLLGRPLIWAFQPFCAFVLAGAVGPAWLLARRMGLSRPWAALAALTSVVPALVYAYALFGSIKELTALSMILTLGCLVVVHRSWLGGPAARVIPFALVLAAGVSALGIAFGAWALVPVLVLAAILLDGLRKGTRGARRTLALAGAGAIVLAIAAWPTWTHVSAAFTIATDIANTANSGNLHVPLRASQVLGVWLRGSYKLAPTGGALTLTDALIVLTLLAAILGTAHLLRTRSYALAGWMALMLVAWLAVTRLVTTWANAKTLVLTSPAVMLLAWAGVAALKAQPVRSRRAPQRPMRPRTRAAPSARGAVRTARPSRLASIAAALLALAIAGGVLVSDALQYHSSDLAPTARYEELASVNSRFAGRGPTLFTDFDEYAMYELRDMDVGGPDFAYPPPALAATAGGHGEPVALDRASPTALAAYPLIVTRRDPSASRPPAAYLLLWQGSYYQVWGRRPGAPAASEHVALTGSAAQQCARIADLARAAGGGGERLVVAQAPRLIGISLAHAAHPARWGHTLRGTLHEGGQAGEREGLVMSTPGSLSASFALPASGLWDVWVQGQIMPTVKLSVDGRQIASIAGQLDGNSLVPNTVPPIAVHLAAGAHRIAVVRGGFSLAPGEGGAAVLDAIFLTPANGDPQGPLRTVAPADWPSLCGRSYQWIEVTRA